MIEQTDQTSQLVPAISRDAASLEVLTRLSEPVASLIMVTSGTQRQQQLELLRWMLLQEAEKASSRGLPASTYHLAVHLRGLNTTLEEIEREIGYLVDKKLLATAPKPSARKSLGFVSMPTAWIYSPNTSLMADDHGMV